MKNNLAIWSHSYLPNTIIHTQCKLVFCICQPFSHMFVVIHVFKFVGMMVEVVASDNRGPLFIAGLWQLRASFFDNCY